VTVTANGSTVCGPISVSTTTGKATCQVTETAAGSHTIQASYSGDTAFASSTGSLTQTVTAAAGHHQAASITLTRRPDPRLHGGAGQPDHRTGDLQGHLPKPGARMVVATYSADNSFSSAVSSTHKQLVKPSVAIFGPMGARVR
jgi:hypothetical protein